jgi:HAD superfamily hydrolase (TIGR01549 family)
MKKGAIIFDKDLTLINSFDTSVKVHQLTAKQYYNLDINENDVRQLWGQPIDKLYQTLYQTDQSYQVIAQHVMKVREENKLYSQPYNGVKELLDQLSQHYYLGIITSSSTQLSIEALLETDINVDIFKFIYGIEDTIVHKPNPKVFAKALNLLDELDIKKNITYVGDAIMDWQAARDAGLNFFGVTTGFVTKQEFIDSGVNIDNVVDQVSNLINYF